MISVKYDSRALLLTAESNIIGKPFERIASGDPLSASRADLASAKAAGKRYAPYQDRLASKLASGTGG
jgi:hypothetical protein